MKTISKQIILASKIASKNSCRPLLSSVYVDNDYIMATDSAKIVRFSREHCPDVEDFPIIPSVEPLTELEKPLIIEAKELRKQKFYKSKSLSVLEYGVLNNLTDGSVSLATTDLSTASNGTYKLIQGEYPDVTTILKPEKELQTDDYLHVSVNPKILKELLEAFQDAKDDRVDLYISKTNNLEPIRLKSEGIEGAIMPLRK